MNFLLVVSVVVENAHLQNMATPLAAHSGCRLFPKFLAPGCSRGFQKRRCVWAWLMSKRMENCFATFALKVKIQINYGVRQAMLKRME